MKKIQICFTGGLGPKLWELELILKMMGVEAVSQKIAADSGLKLCLDLGFDPDFVIGDMDSVDKNLLAKISPEKIIEYSTHKDFTDTELAIEKAQKHNTDEIWLIGGGGGRMDHFLAHYHMFMFTDKVKLWMTEEDIFFRVEKELKIEAEFDELISVFPAQLPLEIRSEGLFWQLEGITWIPGQTGISNRAIAETIELVATRGSAILNKKITSLHHS